MKKILTLISLMAISIACQNTPKNDWEENNLKGKVKSVKQITYETSLDESGTPQKGKISTDSYKNFEEFFHPNGFLNEIRYFDANNNLKEYDIYQYDAKNKLSEIHSFNQNKELKKKTHYIYDKKGNVSQKIYESLNGLPNIKKTFTYHSNGQKATELTYNAEGVLESKMKFSYHSDNGKVSKFTYYDANDVLMGEIFITYNRESNPIEEKYDLKGLGKFSFRYEYIYDTNKNWVQQVQYSDKEPVRMIERTIIYY